MRFLYTTKVSMFSNTNFFRFENETVYNIYKKVYPNYKDYFVELDGIQNMRFVSEPRINIFYVRSGTTYTNATKDSVYFITVGHEPHESCVVV